MKNNIAARAAVILLSCGLSACVSLGRQFDTGAVKGIVEGRTTQSEIETTFGSPFRTGLDSGDTTWTYINYSFGLFSRQKAVDLVVRFNADGTVKSYTFNSTEE